MNIPEGILRARTRSGLTTPSPDRSTLAGRATEARQAKGLTQRELARGADMSQQTVGSIESGRSNTPQAKTLLAIAKVLGVSPGWLLFGEENNVASPHHRPTN